MSDVQSDATLTPGLAPKKSNAVPPSLGKTAIVAGSVPLAIQELLVDTFGPGGAIPHEWFTPHYASNLMIVAVGLAGWAMHLTQRNKENQNA